MTSTGINIDDIVLKQATTVTKGVDYTLTVDDDIIWVDASAGPVTITMFNPTGITGQTFQIQKIDSSTNVVTVDGGGVLLNGHASGELRRQWAYIKPTSDGIGYKI